MFRDRQIIIVLYTLELGGAERQALLLARHLIDQQGARVQVWGFTDPGRVVELCQEYEVPCQVVPIRLSLGSRTNILKAALQLGALLRSARADIVLPYLTPPNILCGLAWRLAGARTCIWNQRNGGIDRVDPLLEIWAARFTPWFISNSNEGARFLARTYRIKQKRVRVIHNGIDIDQWMMNTPVSRHSLDVREHSFLACMVANLHGDKDHVTLLKAWRRVVSRLANTGRDAVLLLAGRFDSMAGSLRKLSADLGIDGHVRFLGQVADVAGLMRAVDMGILISNSEGCPNAVLEYMASGLPVVGTDIPGIRDIVDASVYPFLVPLGNEEILADRILQLAANPELRAKVGLANRKRVRAEFTSQRMCDSTVRFLTECVKL